MADETLEFVEHAEAESTSQASAKPRRGGRRPGAGAKPKNAENAPVAKSKPNSDDLENKTAAEVEEDLNRLILNQQKQFMLEQLRSKEENDRIRKLCNLSAQERTQLHVDKTYGTEGPRYVVCIPEPRAGQLVLTIPAASPEDAIGRYQTVCGIRFSHHEFGVWPEDEAPENPIRSKKKKKDAYED